MGMINRLWAGEKVLCPVCKKGSLQPRLSSQPLNKNYQFICPECGNKVIGIPKMKRDD